MTKLVSKKRKVELRAIADWVKEGESVLDLGCGRGILLEELVKLKNIYAVGIDSDFEKVVRCVKRGINVIHGDIVGELAAFGDKSFDWIICSRTLPELADTDLVIKESLRVAKRVAVGFINHGFWYNRLYLMLHGERTVNEVFPNSWDKSRPLNQISISSFKEYCKKNDIKINREHFLKGDWRSSCGFAPNLMAGYALFEISK